MKLLRRLVLLALIVVSCTLLPAAPPTVSAQTTTPIFLPIILSPPSVAPPIFATFDRCTDPPNEPVIEPEMLEYGFYALAYATLINARPGSPYRIEWTIDGERIRELDQEGVTETSSEEMSGSIAINTVDPDTNRIVERCSEPVYRGSYEIDFFIDDVLYRETSFEIR